MLLLILLPVQSVLHSLTPTLTFTLTLTLVLALTLPLPLTLTTNLTITITVLSAGAFNNNMSLQWCSHLSAAHTLGCDAFSCDRPNISAS